MNNKNLLVRRRLIEKEGLKLTAYKDSEKQLWHIGIGHLLEQQQSEEEEAVLGPDFHNYDEDNYEGFTITEQQAFDLFDIDVQDAIDDVYPFFTHEQLDALGETRRSIIIEMAFQMGGGGLRKFKKFKAAVEAEDWENAAHEMMTGSKGGPSKWMRQTPDRCQSAADAMKVGYFAEYQLNEADSDPKLVDMPYMPPLSDYSSKELLEELLRRDANIGTEVGKTIKSPRRFG